jgi:hypothetical protein
MLDLTQYANRAIQKIETREVCPAGKPRRVFDSSGRPVGAPALRARAPAAGGHEGHPYAITADAGDSSRRRTEESESTPLPRKPLERTRTFNT